MTVFKPLFRITQFALVSFILGACNSPLPQMSGTASISSPSPAPILTKTIPPSYENLPSATFRTTQVSISSLAPTPSITPVPAPTFPLEDAQEQVQNLMKTNGGCKLPCWWGEIIPGQTRWEDARAFLQPFASEIVLGTPYPNGELYWISFAVPESVRNFRVLEVPIKVRAGIVDQIFIGQYYPLTHLLVDYGAPNEIWIQAVGVNTIMPEGRFTIALFWNNKGILASFEGRTEKTNPLPICMDKLEEPDEPALWLWDPNHPRTIEEIGGELLFGIELAKREFFRLEKATNLDIASYYKTYVTPDNLSVCFEMPDPDLP